MKKVTGVALPLIILPIVTVLYADRIDLPFWAICVIFVALVIAGLAIALYRLRLRTQALAVAARELGMAFTEEGTKAAFEPFLVSSTPGRPAKHAAETAAVDPDQLLSQTVLKPLNLFQVGRRWVIRDVMAGRLNGLEALIFDYAYRTSSDRSSNPSWTGQTVAAFRIPGRTFPAFELSPQRLLHTIAAKMGFQDINFESHPEFSKRFLLRGDVESDVRTLFTPSVLHSFARLDEDFDLTVTGGGDCVVAYKPNRNVKPARIAAFAEQAKAVAAAFRG